MWDTKMRHSFLKKINKKENWRKEKTVEEYILTKGKANYVPYEEQCRKANETMTMK